MSHSELLLSIALGIGLAAAVGFRVFLPLLIVSVASYTGHLPLSPEMSWLGTLSAMATLGVAAVIEIIAYYVPGVDNALDAITTPMALFAGTVVTAAVLTDLPPLVKWSTAIIAGGGAAGLTQSATALLRAKSTAFTGGLGNSFIASGEIASATVISLLAVFAPIVALILVVLFCWLVVRLARRIFVARS
jgi:hypothetical protein